MARRSREDMATEKKRKEQKGKQNKLFSTAIYARLSIENSRQSEEKEVIENQINFCKSFIAENPDMELSSIFFDDGATGTNFKRDGFQNLINHIESGEIDCVVVRDFSRFGRNRLDCLHYLEPTH